MGDYLRELKTWRMELEDSLRTDDGWLTLVGLYWLHIGQNPFGSAPNNTIQLPDNTPLQAGYIQYEADQFILHPTTNELFVFTEDGQHPIQEPISLQTDRATPTIISIGTVRFFLIQRGDQVGVRVRDLANPARQTFAGRSWYAPDPTYRVTGHFNKHASPREMTIQNSAGQTVAMTNVGHVAFSLADQGLFLEAFDNGPDSLFLVFKDATSGIDTYGAGRFLVAPLAADGQNVDLDFNRAYFPPCAFTPYATCPRPPKENILPVAVPAGERT
jgi:uncharacterized protein